MKLATMLAGLLGALLTGVLLARFGMHAVAGLVLSAGWGLAGALVLHGLQTILSARSWQIMTADAGATLRLRDFFLLRCVREGVNNLLPVAQVGGEVVTGRLLARRGPGTRRAAAATICDLTLELLSQLALTALGLLVLLMLVHRSHTTDLLLESSMTALIAGVVMAALQFCGALSIVEGLLLRIGGHLGWTGTEGVRGLNSEILSLYKRGNNAPRAGFAQFLGWLLGTFEVCVILGSMGHPATVSQGLVIESVGQAAKSVGFAVPGALGVSEGGYILICGLFGFPPPVAISLSLVKRLRELAWGLPSLGLWSWLEHHWCAPAQHDAVSVPRRWWSWGAGARDGVHGGGPGAV
ncbi:hypothetical protein AA103196_0742 [Ameyamaea chiangmaiensis NBRC 103196]|uniref:Flippase-like domain-containing protein n=1 Tax=Ameyamaea chiangmaiensis TaxID=442969 RepID=A0A850P3P4_9PROT|nr:flippase-like domain-containing protein [Ameyamaea chiangmaiensis]MBS4075844.1 flippase-like domain-containing protein [Ameyamaea chiangmaiensis]NVN39285.1 flippase-like domain-containing protein [Ameyamaea chiangmaiensis]GBQ63958.1 hypothetical protein AA103196_0742 [Ameyamaea chiangmaiensis NBRC 103196]